MHFFITIVARGHNSLTKIEPRTMAIDRMAPQQNGHDFLEVRAPRSSPQRLPSRIMVPAVVLAFVHILASANAHAQLLLEREPVNYSKTESRDPASLLSQRIQKGEVSLDATNNRTLLASLLDALEISTSSQTLVFSKTSMQRHLISPENPRAIYFNDETYVGWIPNGELIEIASTDPMLGTVFHIIDTDADKTQMVRRTDRCLFCHASTDTGRVPGLLIQSVFSDASGNRSFPQTTIDTRSYGPIAGRWGGWFVTGDHGRQSHLGNLMIESSDRLTAGTFPESDEPVDLAHWFDVAKYPTGHSDIVALLVLQHQVTLHNLLTSVNHRAGRWLHEHKDDIDTRSDGRPTVPQETEALMSLLARELVDGLLMVNDVSWNEPISGSSSFMEDFQSLGPRDARGRSLRTLDLRKRLFRYPCSYLIYSESFDTLPAPLLDQVYVRLRHVLQSKKKEENNRYNHLTADDRRAILDILTATKENLPEWWSDGREGVHETKQE